MDPTQTPHPSLGGVPAKESPRGLHVDSTTPRGVHVESRRNLWGRVKSSLFYPVTSYRKISILISSLPGITCETYKSCFIALKISMSRLVSTKVTNKNPTVSLRCKLFKFFLKSSMICLQLALRLGMLMPLVAQDAISIIL